MTESVELDSADEASNSVWARLDRRLLSRGGRLTAAGIALVALALAVVVGVLQVRLTGCLSDYNNASAVSTAARAQAAAEDRKADDADRAADAQDREAFKVLVDAIAGQDQAGSKTAFINLVAVYRQTDAERATTAKTRADNERKRAANPVPPPPNLKCG